MTIAKRHRRTARKLILPLIAVATMATMMALHSGNPGQHAATSAAYQQ